MNRVLAEIARRHEASLAGRTGAVGRDLSVDAEELLASLGARDGRPRQEAERGLAEAERLGILAVERHRRDPSILERIRFSPASEVALYRHLGIPSPSERRARLAAQFASALEADVPARWRARWSAWCAGLRDAAAVGGPIAGFDRDAGPGNGELLALLPRLLAWEGESLVRFASCVLCGDSKRLESLAPPDREGESEGRLRGRLGRLLADVTGGEIASLDDLGITRNPRFALVHGPLWLDFGGPTLDLGALHGPVRLSLEDVRRAVAVGTRATRVLTVENETTFHELAKLRSGVLLVQTSFPGAATVALIGALPAGLEWWHFGDSDDAGFEILRVLREKTGRDFRPLHMERGRVPFEQEALGRPGPTWPFYPGVARTD